MLKFLAAKKIVSNDWADVHEEKRYTRFENRKRVPPVREETIEPVAASHQGPTTRMVHRHFKDELKSSAPVQFDESAHLYASTSIPLGILKKALPMRFARLNRSSDSFGLFR